MDGAGTCRDCKQSSAALRLAEARIAELEAELSALRELLEEKNRTTELLQADLKRYRYAYNVGQPNCPERVPKDQLQLAFERVLECIPPANDVPDADFSDAANLPSTSFDPSGACRRITPPASAIAVVAKVTVGAT
ncbi:MAG: hypothetical protein ABI895_12205 [Deltaproteobacteria bacterium]